MKVISDNLEEKLPSTKIFTVELNGAEIILLRATVGNASVSDLKDYIAQQSNLSEHAIQNVIDSGDDLFQTLRQLAGKLGYDS